MVGGGAGRRGRSSVAYDGLNEVPLRHRRGQMRLSSMGEWPLLGCQDEWMAAGKVSVRSNLEYVGIHGEGWTMICLSPPSPITPTHSRPTQSV